MSEQDFTPEKVSVLIDQLLKAKDPAVVGLRRILRHKLDEGTDFPVKEVVQEDFGAQINETHIFSDNEKHLLQLEKQIRDNSAELAAQRAKTEQALQAAFEKGRKAGMAQGLKEGETRAAVSFNKRLNELETRIETMVFAMGNAKKSMYLDSRQKLLELAFLLARKIVNQEIQTDSSVIESVLSRALNHVAYREQVIVRVCPQDYETLSGKTDFWKRISERREGVSIESDERVERGGCIIDSPAGVTDSRISVQFEELREVVERTWEASLSNAGTGTAYNDATQPDEVCAKLPISGAALPDPDDSTPVS